MCTARLLRHAGVSGLAVLTAQPHACSVASTTARHTATLCKRVPCLGCGGSSHTLSVWCRALSAVQLRSCRPANLAWSGFLKVTGWLQALGSRFRMQPAGAQPGDLTQLSQALLQLLQEQQQRATATDMRQLGQYKDERRQQQQHHTSITEAQPWPQTQGWLH